MKYFITGDIHGDFKDLKDRIMKKGIKEGDCLIILGDACFNYFNDIRDLPLKSKANNLGITLFCIQGNHEIRPNNIETYKKKKWNRGTVWYEPDFPNILFAKDAEVYNINNKKMLVIGGAYSVDKYYRMARYVLNTLDLRIPYEICKDIIRIAENNKGVTLDDKAKVDAFMDNFSDTTLFHWWKDEQIYSADKDKINSLITRDNQYDVVLSHTCPQKYEPTEVFLKGLNQDMVDKSMEIWLNEIEKKIEYKKWYAGHYHINKDLHNGFEFLFKNVKEFGMEE